MSQVDVTARLSQILSEDELSEASEQLIEEWMEKNIGADAIGPVLEFMERHPEWDFGVPGPFVHFVERFYGVGYESKLIESIKRRPTEHTVWMLNRLINGERNPERKLAYVKAMEEAKRDAVNDPKVAERIDHFLTLHPRRR